MLENHNSQTNMEQKKGTHEFALQCLRFKEWIIKTQENVSRSHNAKNPSGEPATFEN